MPSQAATGCLTVPIFVGPALLSKLLGGRSGASSFQGLSGAQGRLQKLRGSSGCLLSVQATSVCWASPGAASHLLEGSCQFPVQLDSWRGGTRHLCTPLQPTPLPSAPRRIPQGLSVCSPTCTHVDSLEVALYMPGPRLQFFWPTRLASHFPLLPFIIFFLFGGVQAPTQSLKRAKSMPVTTVNLRWALLRHLAPVLLFSFWFWLGGHARWCFGAGCSWLGAGVGGCCCQLCVVQC